MANDGRVTLVGYTCSPLGMQTQTGPDVQHGITGEALRVIKQLDEDAVQQELQKVFDSGIKSLAVCFMHAYTFPQHEQRVAELAREIGFDNITTSSAIMPMIKIVPRGTSATVDAYLTPCIQRYLDGFFSGFDAGIKDVKVEFMQSDGGLTPVDRFSGFRAILSGPAGGAVGFAQTCFDAKEASPVIGFDMGGTSTDVSRYAGRYEHVFETTTAGVTIQAPQLDINTVAAGGGSRLFFRNGLFVVGPESASSHPGPACYKKGGPLAITDANLLLGRLIPECFPKIFGPNENEPLDINATRALFTALAKDINAYQADNKLPEMSLDEIAYGFIKVADETMSRPIRTLTEAKGYDTASHVLASFGGAGAQHACSIAKSLGIKRILIHRYASILSAYGLSLADVVFDVQEPAAVTFSPTALPDLQKRFATLEAKCKTELVRQGFADEMIQVEYLLNLRYSGTDTSLMILKPLHDFKFDDAFVAQYKQEFGFTLPDRDIIVDDVRVRGIGKTTHEKALSVYDELSSLKLVPVDPNLVMTTTNAYFEGGRRPTPVYDLETLGPGSQLRGPAIIVEPNSVIVVLNDCDAVVTSKHVVISVGSQGKARTGTALDPIQLSIFSHRFMSIAEQMGHTLQKTSVSTNIKERLDFSCALFGPDGSLTSNAPHLPVHLGSMGKAVEAQIRMNPDLIPGDVLVSNHPAAGGSHLPDITVITPVFHDKQVVFYVASRGHHADIGGLEPGSMPPFSKHLFEEGAAIKSFKLVQNGAFNEEGIVKLLVDEPARYAGCSGTRNLQDNLSDLKAQVAANQRGIALVQSLIKEYGLEVVQAYMRYIRDNAEFAVRQLLAVMAKHHGTHTLEAVDYMDDGTPIKLRITIDTTTKSAQFDFTGTGPQVYGNTNAPHAITYSAIIYCLRSLVGQDIPLNQGCLVPIDVVIPPGSLLSPSDDAAVVGGNVQTSQRLVDVILRAFGACAASQGDMNNLTFGADPSVVGKGCGWGYYETIAGGTGAGPGWHGRTCHSHMTNTRITDAEILERRYPVLLREFSIRRGSGGHGQFNGGDGIVRELQFLEPLQVSILSERRVFEPYGLKGGLAGQRGRNLLIQSGRMVSLGGKNTVSVKKGDILRIETPGGGGWGQPGTPAVEEVSERPLVKAGGSAMQRHLDQHSV